MSELGRVRVDRQLFAALARGRATARAEPGVRMHGPTCFELHARRASSVCSNSTEAPNYLLAGGILYTANSWLKSPRSREKAIPVSVQVVCCSAYAYGPARHGNIIRTRLQRPTDRRRRAQFCPALFVRAVSAYTDCMITWMADADTIESWRDTITPPPAVLVGGLLALFERHVCVWQGAAYRLGESGQ